MTERPTVTTLVSRPWYSRWDALGNEIGDVRWFRVGIRRWYVEAGKWGIVVRFGSVHLSLHFDQSEDD